MEVKINREIRDYTESMFFGLSMRQLLFSLVAIGVAVLLYFILKPLAGMETTSWACILGAAPFAAMGFVKYHGMTAEQFIWAWLKSELIEPRELTFRPSNLYMEMLEEIERDRKQDKGKEKESVTDGNENTEEHLQEGPYPVQSAVQGAGCDPYQKDLG